MYTHIYLLSLLATAAPANEAINTNTLAQLKGLIDQMAQALNGIPSTGDIGGTNANANKPIVNQPSNGNTVNKPVVNQPANTGNNSPPATNATANPPVANGNAPATTAPTGPGQVTFFNKCAGPGEVLFNGKTVPENCLNGKFCSNFAGQQSSATLKGKQSSVGLNFKPSPQKNVFYTIDKFVDVGVEVKSSSGVGHTSRCVNKDCKDVFVRQDIGIYRTPEKNGFVVTFCPEGGNSELSSDIKQFRDEQKFPADAKPFNA
ncbi:hypothetical protein BC833DRAFT_595102 [Globomyces pollinis-pini]|nr:hypothetical protein BC833DRAFT_595102 [Globomyces pollinis-pini]KAJ2992682.1 hypothetical protein HDV02_002908 [Globomyces sp. JEL0801]